MVDTHMDYRGSSYKVEISDEPMSNKDMNLSEFSRRGGKKTLEKYGKKHFADISKNSSKTIKEKYGDDYYKKISQKGVEARKKKRAEAAAKPSSTMVQNTP